LKVCVSPIDFPIHLDSLWASKDSINECMVVNLSFVERLSEIRESLVLLIAFEDPRQALLLLIKGT
jgi:hypothetical protein